MKDLAYENCKTKQVEALYYRDTPVEDLSRDELLDLLYEVVQYHIDCEVEHRELITRETNKLSEKIEKTGAKNRLTMRHGD